MYFCVKHCNFYLKFKKYIDTGQGPGLVLYEKDHLWGPGAWGEKGVLWGGGSQARARAAMQEVLQMPLPMFGIYLDPHNFVWHLKLDSHVYQEKMYNQIFESRNHEVKTQDLQKLQTAFNQFALTVKFLKIRARVKKNTLSRIKLCNIYAHTYNYIFMHMLLIYCIC